MFLGILFKNKGFTQSSAQKNVSIGKHLTTTYHQGTIRLSIVYATYIKRNGGVSKCNLATR